MKKDYDFSDSIKNPYTKKLKQHFSFFFSSGVPGCRGVRPHRGAQGGEGLQGLGL